MAKPDYLVPCENCEHGKDYHKPQGNGKYSYCRVCKCNEFKPPAGYQMFYKKSASRDSRTSLGRINGRMIEDEGFL